MGTTKKPGGSSGSRPGAERPLWSFPADGNSDWGKPTEIPAWADSPEAGAAPAVEQTPAPAETSSPGFGEKRDAYAGRSARDGSTKSASSWGSGNRSGFKKKSTGSWGSSAGTKRTSSKRSTERTGRTRTKAVSDSTEPIELSDEQYATKGRAVILRQLTASAKSRAQLRTKLLEKEIPERIAEELLDRFEDIQLVDDEAFAEGWVRSRARSRGLARSAIRRELRDKGIEGELAETALEQIDEDTEEATAKDLVERKLRAPSMAADKEKTVRRLVGMLARKGYSSSMAYRLVNESWEERFGDDAEY